MPTLMEILFGRGTGGVGGVGTPPFNPSAPPIPTGRAPAGGVGPPVGLSGPAAGTAPKTGLAGFNQRLSEALQQPATQFGLNLLAQSGPSLAPQSFGASVGRAGQETLRQQQSQSLQDLQKRLLEARIGATQNQSANTNVQSTFEGENGNMFIVTRNGQVKDTGVKFNESLRTVSRPDGSVVLVDTTRGAQNEPIEVVSPEEAVSGASTLAGATQEAKTTAQKTTEGQFAGRQDLGRIDEEVARNEEMLARMKAGDFQTGPIAGRFPAVTTAGQEFDVFSGEGIIDAIGSATFGALSEGEREFLRSTVPSRDKTEEANIAIIERRLRILERARKRAEQKTGDPGIASEFEGFSIVR